MDEAVYRALKQLASAAKVEREARREDPNDAATVPLTLEDAETILRWALQYVTPRP